MKVKVYNDSDLIKTINKYFNENGTIKAIVSINGTKEKIIINFEKTNNNDFFEFEDSKLKLEVSNLLHALGIPSNIKGYHYARTAILMVYNNPDYIDSITKGLYPDLSVRFNTSIYRVERAIRHAIEVSCLRGDIDLMEELFGHSIDTLKAKPTNSEFIVTLADYLHFDMIKTK